MMSVSDIVDVLSRLQQAGLAFWLDGGWAVDALIGEETRLHDDLDIVVRLDEVDRLVDALDSAGFVTVLDNRPTRLVLEGDADRRIDAHPVVFEADGTARQIGAGPRGGDAFFPAWGLEGVGRVADREFPCLAPKLLVLFHTGYEPQQKDWHNVWLLCERFGIEVPSSYARFGPCSGDTGRSKV